MRKTKKFIASALSLILSFTVFIGLSACGGRFDNDDEQTLRIFTTNAGYGTEWLEKTIEAFKSTSWVKEKYPNLNIPTPDKDAVSSIATKITSGKNGNPYSLLFSCQPCGAGFEAKDSSGEYYFEDLSDVYFGAIPGESDYDGTDGKQLKDKMNANCFEGEKVLTLSNDTFYFGFPWVRGHGGLFYNKTKLDNCLGNNYKLPNTTDELLAMSKTLYPILKERNDAPWAYVTGSMYIFSLLNTWWPQYAGLTGYELFWKGEDENGEYSPANFKNKGRLYALETLEKLIGYFPDESDESGVGTYTHKASITNTFMQLQTKWITGKAGIFMPVGDWIENEMSGTKTNQDLRMLQVPVLSNIIELCDSINSDEQLSFVIDCVDQKKNFEEAKVAYQYGELKEEDYNRISEARRMISRMSGHQAFIPSYGVAKELAKDFLRFMATNKGIEIFMSCGGGLQTAFDYKVSKEMYNTFSSIQKSHYDILQSDPVELLGETSFRLYNYGGMKAFRETKPDKCFNAQNPKDRKSAQDIFNDEVEYYTKENNANFLAILKNSGLR